MSEEIKDTVNKALEEKENRYDAIKDNPLQKEFQEMKAEYKAAVRNCRTIHEKNTVMITYQSDLMDIACEAQMLNDWNLLTQLNTIITSIDRRTARRSFKRY